MKPHRGWRRRGWRRRCISAGGIWRRLKRPVWCRPFLLPRYSISRMCLVLRQSSCLSFREAAVSLRAQNDRGRCRFGSVRGLCCVPCRLLFIFTSTICPGAYCFVLALTALFLRLLLCPSVYRFVLAFIALSWRLLLCPGAYRFVLAFTVAGSLSVP